MTWPTCVDCRKEYIPVATLNGCPWCSGSTARRAAPHLQDEYRTCPTCGGPMRRHAKHCWDCYLRGRRAQ